MVMGQDLELCNSKMWILHAFSLIYFIFQGSPENHSKTHNNFRNIHPAAAFEEPIISYIWIHILICNNLQ